MSNPHDASLHNQLVASAGADLFKLMGTLRRAASRAFEPLGLTALQANALMAIDRGCTSPNELADILDIHRTAISALLRELEQQTLIERHVETDDKRRVNVSMTSSGSEALANLEQVWQDASALHQLTNEELRGFSNVCRKALQAKPS